MTDFLRKLFFFFPNKSQPPANTWTTVYSLEE